MTCPEANRRGTATWATRCRSSDASASNTVTPWSSSTMSSWLAMVAASLCGGDVTPENHRYAAGDAPRGSADDRGELARRGLRRRVVVHDGAQRPHHRGRVV